MSKSISRSSVLAAVLAVATVNSTIAGPGGVYNSSAPTPAYKSDAPPTREAKNAVSPDGAATYVVPFAVPPGRAGAQPDVALHYSSRAPLRGGIAAGWSLPIPMISVDTSAGRLAKVHYQIGGRRLIEVDEPGATGVSFEHHGYDTYRADGDTSYTRYEHHWDGTEQGYWLARYLDGSIAYFGKTWDSRDQRTEGMPGDKLYGGQGRWFISYSQDKNGNLVEYSYEVARGAARNGAIVDVPVDLALRTIHYGKNANVPSSRHHAKIDFVWRTDLQTCPGSAVPIGAQFTYRTGIRLYEGARKLLAIQAKVYVEGRWIMRREMQLGYRADTESCDQPHGPLRMLETIQEKAWGPDDPEHQPSVVLPPMTFTYGPLEYRYSPSNSPLPPLPDGSFWYGISSTKDMHHVGKPGGWPSLDVLVEDLDGDGVVEQRWGDVCESLPTVPWANGASPHPDDDFELWEGCSLAAQVTRRTSPRAGNTVPGNAPPPPLPGPPHPNSQSANYNGYRFIDVNGDGRLDLLAALDYDKKYYRPREDPALAADYPACSSLPAPPCVDIEGDRTACLFAPAPQMVFPLDNSFGSSGDWHGPFLVAESGGSAASLAGGLDDTMLPDDENPLSCGGGEMMIPNCGALIEGSTGPTFPGPGPTFPDPIGAHAACCVPSPPAQEYCRWCPPMTWDEGPTGAYAGAPTVEESSPSMSFTSSDYLRGNVPDLHCGYYVYRVYLNESTKDSGLAFGSGHVVRSPVPLDAMGLTTSFGTGTANASNWRAIVDLDGDERPDAIYQRPNRLFKLDTNGDGFPGGPGDTPDTWLDPAKVWLGSKSGTAGFTGQSDGTGHSWYVPPSPGTPGHAEGRQVLSDQAEWGQFEVEMSGLHDINGDGLLDLVRADGHPALPSSAGVRVFYNTGAGFEDGPGTVISESLQHVSRTKNWLFPHAGKPALSTASHRPADLDGDGLLDIVEVNVYEQGIAGINPLVPPHLPGTSTPTALVTAHVSVGDRLIAVNAAQKLGKFRNAFTKLTIGQDRVHRTVSDFSDVNGDGAPDMILPGTTPAEVAACQPTLWDFDPNTGAPRGMRWEPQCAESTLVYHAAAEPLRVLRSVDNGLGARVSFDYASIRDTSVVARDSEYDRTKPMWVVRSVSTVNGTATAVTDYRYENPVFNYDRQGRFGFRGFETVIETKPAVLSGARARTYTRYRYDLDPAGLVSRVLTAEVLGNGTEKLIAVAESDYFESALFGGAVVAYQRDESIMSTCATPVTGTGEASVSACLASAGVARTSEEWIDVESGTTSADRPVLHVIGTARRLPTRAESTAGVRHESFVVELRYGENQYQLLQRETRTHDGGATRFSKVRRSYDARGNVLDEDVYVDDTTFATTTTTYDAFGNVETTTRPNQQHEWMPLEAHITYDALGLYPRLVTNELGHQSVSKYDLGTGVAVETQGPEENGKRLVVHSRIDGLGRVVERRRGVVSSTFDPTELDLVFSAAYVDTGVRSVTTEERLDHGPSARWSKTITKFDALGNITREERPAAEGVAVTTFTYDSASRLTQVTVPHPSGSGTIGYRWAYDGLGREIRSLPPLTAPIDTTYNGLTTVVVQRATDSSMMLRKRIDKDGFGRIVAVTEGVATPVTTEYTYDAADRLVSIVDADGVETQLEYDQRGLRTAITRDKTTFRYVYDLNGNRKELHHPTGTAPFDPAVDISRWHYDALDRVTESHPAPRRWTDDDRRRFGPDGASTSLVTKYTYDLPEHGFGLGRLTRVETPVMTTDYTYTGLGEVEKEERRWSIAPAGKIWTGEAVQTTTYDPRSAPLTVTYPDGSTVAKYSYDDRGRPSRVDVSGGVTSFAQLRRNLGGYVTKRETPTSGVVQSWTRDAAGRVTASEIKGTWGCAPSASCPIAIIGGETATFDSLGNVRTSTERGRGIVFEYGYDERDQLSSVTTPSTNAYVGTFQYSGAGKLRRATVHSALPGAEVLDRDVSYDYTPHNTEDTADPAAVRALVDVLTGDEIVNLLYDPSGSLIARTSPDGSHTFVYDADGKLREAVDTATGAFEVYYYDHTGARVLTYREAPGQSGTVRHRFGRTELFHKEDGAIERTTVDVGLADSVVLRVTRSPDPEVEQLFHGALGNLLVTGDMSGRGKARFGYGAFGEILYQEGPSAAAFDHRYSGKARDALTKLSYYGARYYDPLTLTWTQADPFYRFVPDAALTEPLRMGLYTFNLNNPIRYVDPDGLSPKHDPTKVKLDEGYWFNVGNEKLGLEVCHVEATLSRGNLAGEFNFYKLNSTWNGVQLGLELEAKGVNVGLGIGTEGLKASASLLELEAGLTFGNGLAKYSVGWTLGLGVEATWKNGKMRLNGKAAVSLGMEIDGKKAIRPAAELAISRRYGKYGPLPRINWDTQPLPKKLMLPDSFYTCKPGDKLGEPRLMPSDAPDDLGLPFQTWTISTPTDEDYKNLDEE